MLHITIAAALSLSQAAPAQSPPASPSPASIDAIFATMAQPDVPGCAIGVSRNGKIVASRAYGSADLEHDVPLSPATILEAGSVSKQFTAAAILLLVEDGKLALTDDVRRHMPELPDYGATITIDHLLNHTSGLRDWGAVAELGGWPRGTRFHMQADAVEIIRRQRSLNYAPGAEYSYTNSGYNLLTEIVRRVSGKSLADFSRNRIFAPLGMTGTSWRDDFRRLVKNRGIAYSTGAGGFAQDMPFEDVYGNGGLLTTVGDLMIWNEALAGNRLGKALTERLQQPAKLNDGTPITYARGLFIERYRGLPAIVHGGATGGYRTWLGRFPDQQLTVALLCNRADVASARIGQQVADLYLPAATPSVAETVQAGPGLSGLFVNSLTGRSVQLAMDKGTLTIDGTVRLVAVGTGRFRFGDGALQVLDENRFRALDPQGQSAEYRRTAQVTPTRDQLAAYAGRFVSDEADAMYVVTRSGGALNVQLDRRPQIMGTLKPTYADAFEGDGMIVRFERNPAGEITAMSMGIARVRKLRFIRVPEL